MEGRKVSKNIRMSVYIPEEFFPTLAEFDKIIHLENNINVNDVKQVKNVNQLRSVAIRYIMKKYVDQVTKKLNLAATV